MAVTCLASILTGNAYGTAYIGESIPIFMTGGFDALHQNFLITGHATVLSQTYQVMGQNARYATLRAHYASGETNPQQHIQCGNPGCMTFASANAIPVLPFAYISAQVWNTDGDHAFFASLYNADHPATIVLQLWLEKQINGVWYRCTDKQTDGFSLTSEGIYQARVYLAQGDTGEWGFNTYRLVVSGATGGDPVQIGPAYATLTNY